MGTSGMKAVPTKYESVFALDSSEAIEYNISPKHGNHSFVRKSDIAASSQGVTTRPFCLFEYEGHYYAHHYALEQSICLSRSAYESLGHLSDNGACRSDNPILADEIAKLKEAGFFDACPMRIPNDRQFANLLERRYSTPWTKLELALSETCNLACRYCYCGTCRGKMPNQGLMSESVARQAINGLFASSGRESNLSITFFGGEPLLNKPVLKFAISYSQKLARLHGKKVFYSMTTNGTLIDDEVVSLIKRHNFGLMVSLDGPKELHDSQCPSRGGSGSYDTAVTGIRKLMARRRRVTVRCTMAHPTPNMMSLVRFFEDFGFTRIVLGRVYNPIYPSDCDLNESDSYELERQMKNEVVPWMLSELKEGRMPKFFPFPGIFQDANKQPQTQISPFRCGACRGTTTVGADGTLYPCHRFVGMREWVIGSVSDGPDIEQCKEFWRKYRELVKKRCFSCWAYPLCKGPCPWEVANADGTFCLRERTCEETKVWIKQSAWFRSLVESQIGADGLKRENFK